MSIYEFERNNDREALSEALLTADNAAVRRQAAKALGELDGDNENQARGTQRMFNALRTAVIEDPDESVRTTAVKALEQHGTGELRRVISTLTEQPIDSIDQRTYASLATDERPEIRMLSMAAIGQGSDLGSADIVLNALDDPDHRVRERAIAATTKLGLGRAESALIKALEDEVPAVRSAAATAIGDLNLKTASDALASKTSDDNESVRLAALDALATLGSPAAIEPLAEAMQSHSDAMNRHAIYGLLELLTNVSGSDSHELREQVKSVVKGAPRTTVIDTLVELLDDMKKAPQRRNAVWLLSQLIEDRTTDDAVVALTDLIGDDDEQTSKLATSALIRGDARVVERIVRQRLSEVDPNDTEAGQLAYVLGRVGSDRSIESLEQTLDDTDDDSIRKQVVSALNRLDSGGEVYG